MAEVMSVFSLLGLLSLSAMLVVLAEFSRRLGRVTRAAPYFVWFYVAAVLVAVGPMVRLVNLGQTPHLATTDDALLWVLLYNGAPALGMTIGLLAAWHYWSWLLAERD